MNQRNDQCYTCGHLCYQHIYDEGACRPGFVCEVGCEQFVRLPPMSIVRPAFLPRRVNIHGERMVVS